MKGIQFEAGSSRVARLTSTRCEEIYSLGPEAFEALDARPDSSSAKTRPWPEEKIYGLIFLFKRLHEAKVAAQATPC